MNNQNLDLHLNNNMISDALTAVAHDPRTQVIAFAGLWTLLSEGEFRLNLAVAQAASQLEKENNTTFRNDCLAIYRELRCHQAAPGVSLCEANSIDLNPALVPHMDVMRHMLLDQVPEQARVTSSPSLCRFEYNGGMKLVKSRFNQQKYKDMPLAYQAVSVLNAIGYTINSDVALLRNLPSDPNLDYDKRFASRQLDLLATDYFHGAFYFKHTMDSRGRVYARSVLATPQGDSFAKAALDFTKKKPLGEFGLGALAVHYANTSGHDKLSFADRITWAKTVGLKKAKAFEAAQYDWNIIEPLIEERKEGIATFEEYTAGLDFLRACNSPDYRLYESSLVCHQDATTSGFQFGAALLGDRETAALTNITGDHTKQDKPADLYDEMAKHLLYLLKQPDCDPELNSFLEVVDRKFCKKPIMTTGYGAGLKTIMKHIGEYLCSKSVCRQDLATVNRLSRLQPLVEEALMLTASSMLQLSATMRDAGKLLIERGEETISWTTPDGFTVYQQYRDASHRKVQLQRKSGIRALTAGEIDPLDESKMGTALPPNFIHSADAQLVRTAALSCQHEDIDLTAIHDSFGTHAGTFKQLNTELRHAFVEVMEFDWFNAFRKENSVQLLIEKGEYNSLEALLGTYMFS
ncbi:MAG: hypothetical protein GY799_29420 [Desulfobulbaceae bacterium]|nr:hypothetical protein [Desulfobulbaceae bacterium]